MRTLFLLYFAQGLVLGLAALALLAAAPLLQKRYSARWFCRAWLALAALLALPLRMLLPAAAPAPVTLTPPPALLVSVGSRDETPAIGADTAPGTERTAPSAGDEGGQAVPSSGQAAQGGQAALSTSPNAQPGQSSGQPGPSADAGGRLQTPAVSGGEETPVVSTFTLPAALAPLDGLALAWLAGALGVAGRQWLGYFIWRRRTLRRALPAGGDWQAALDVSLSRQPLAGRPRLLASPDVTGAMAAGFFRPVLLVPEGTQPGPDGVCLLAHELAHLARRDLARKALFSLVLALHWYNPAVWLLAKRAGRDMETACDEAALAALGTQHRAAYCDALLRAVNRGRTPALTTCFSLTKKDVKARFARLWDLSPKRRGAAALAVFCLAAALAGALVACNAAPAESGSEPPAPTPASEPAASPAPDYASDEEIWPVGYYNGAGPLPLPEGEEFPPVTPFGFASPDLQYAGVVQYGLEGEAQKRLTLWNTSDGGETWTSTTLDCSAWLEEMAKENDWASLKADGVGNGSARVMPGAYQFVNPNIGFLAYYGGWNYGPAHDPHTTYAPGFVLLRTTDGGQTWKEMYSGDCSDFVGGTGEGLSFYASRPFLFLNEKVGFLCAHGGDYGTNSQFNLLRTVDGGQTWQLLDLDEVASTLPGAPWKNRHVCSALGLGGPEYEPDIFADAQPGFAAFTAWGDDSYDRVVFYTRDYGESWQWIKRTPADSTSQEVNDQ